MADGYGCCSAASTCCSPGADRRSLVVDFLYLDLSVCQRCQGAESSVDQAVQEVSGVLESAGYEIVVNKVNISSRELAMKYHFDSSPTIRVNGVDIQLSVQESCCKECGELCGDDIDCRVWVYQGVEYTEPPRAMVVDAILKTVYRGQESEVSKHVHYQLPDNLERFFRGLEKGGEL